MRVCSNCGKEKPFEEFHNETSDKAGKQGYCRVCNAAYGKNYRAGLKELRSLGIIKKDGKHKRSKAWWDERKNQCKGTCQVCEEPATERDHNHETGLGRGWLCRACNLAEGLLRSDPDLMMNLACYVLTDGNFPHGMSVPDIFQGPTSSP